MSAARPGRRDAPADARPERRASGVTGPERRASDDPLPAIALGLAALGAVAMVVFGVSAEQLGALGALVLFVGFPIYSIATDHLAERRLGIPVAWRPVRLLVGEAAVVAVLLLLGWGLLQSALRAPQPGDIVCELYDPRLGDCVLERVHTGE